MLPRANYQPLGPVDNREHRFNSVRDEVQQYLLQLNAICCRLRKIPGDLQIDHDALSFRPSMNKCKDLGHYLVEVYQGFLGSRPPKKGPETFDDLGSVLPISDDPLRRRVHIRMVGRVRRKPAKTRLAIRYHGGKRLANFMRNRSSQLSSCRDLGSFRELHLSSFELFFCMLSVGDISKSLFTI
jgi:hypothetical protein